MFQEERYEQILLRLAEDGRVKVSELAKAFSVTEDCIRKDLRELEGKGQLNRVHGGAIAVRRHHEPRSVIERTKINMEAKRVIADKACSLIEDGDIVFLDVSTTNLELARLLAQQDRPITVVSNMPDIIWILGQSTHIIIIAIGGEYARKVSGMVGSEADRYIRSYQYDKAFIGVCGVNAVNGTISTCDLDDGNTKKTIMSCSKFNYLVMEHEKFCYDDLYRFANLDDIESVITEGEIPEELGKLLKSKDIVIL